MLLETTNTLICPRCEQPLSAHVDGECRKPKLSRRFFLGALGSAFAAAAIAKVVPNVVVEAVAEPEQLVVLAAPKAHYAASMTMYYNHKPSQEELQSIAEFLRPVVVKHKGDVIFYHPGKAEDERNS